MAGKRLRIRQVARQTRTIAPLKPLAQSSNNKGFNPIANCEFKSSSPEHNMEQQSAHLYDKSFHGPRIVEALTSCSIRGAADGDETDGVVGGGGLARRV